MSRRAYANVVALLLGGILVLPAFAGANSGGASVGQAAPSGNSSLVQSGNVTITASRDGITFSARVSALLRHQLRFTGTVPASRAGQTVLLERLDRHAGWLPTASAIAAADGTFSATWQTNQSGRFAIRASLRAGGAASSNGAASARVASQGPTLEVTVYRPAIATYYGPGFWGQSTACGQVLTRHMLGVAHRTLPCGTPVAIYYRGRTIVVPVIDRGPYANNASWDLTEATAQALRMDGTASIGATSLPRNR